MEVYKQHFRTTLLHKKIHWGAIKEKVDYVALKKKQKTTKQNKKTGCIIEVRKAVVLPSVGITDHGLCLGPGL